MRTNPIEMEHDYVICMVHDQQFDLNNERCPKCIIDHCKRIYKFAETTLLRREEIQKHRNERCSTCNKIIDYFEYKEYHCLCVECYLK